MELSQIRSYHKGEAVASYLLIQDIHKRRTKDGKPFIDFTFTDTSGKISGKWWDVEDVSHLEEGIPVGVRATVDEFQGKLQLNIEKLVPIKDDAKGFSWDLLIPQTDKNIDAMWNDILQIVEGVKNPYIRKLLDEMIIKDAERLKIWPASMILHHAVRGGLLEHLHGMLNAAIPAAKHYELDLDVVICGILLHDIGKLDELSGFPGNRYTDEGNFTGHIAIGYYQARKVMEAIKSFPPLLMQKIGHIILSHQGEYEYQSPKKPAFPEALFIHYIDELDARMYMMNHFIEEAESGEWTGNRNYFKVALFREIEYDKQEE